MKNFTEYFSILNFAISKLGHSAMEEAYLVASACKTLYIFGNGGSAAISNHWVCDFAKGINEDTSKKATAISLNSNVPLISAIANDIGYEHIFSKQLEYASLQPGDVVFAISSSGNSKNIINGISKAKELGLYTVAFTGFSGGTAATIADTNVHVPSYNYGIVEDIHMMILHAISQRIRSAHATDPKKIRL
jgi:phosphoheptose isomerase